MASKPSPSRHAPTVTAAATAVLMLDTPRLDVIDRLPQAIGLLPVEAALLWTHLGNEILDILRGQPP